MNSSKSYDEGGEGIWMYTVSVHKNEKKKSSKGYVPTLFHMNWHKHT